MLCWDRRKMVAKVFSLHGWTSTPGGLKPTYLKDHGHEVLNSALPDDDFDAAVGIALAEFDRGQPDVVVGSSRGGAVAMNIDAGPTPLVLLCPAWRRWTPGPRLTGHRHRHHELRRGGESHVLATFQVELTGFFATEAQGQKAVLAQEPDRAYDAVSDGPLGVSVVERDDQVVGLVHGSEDQLTHVSASRWLTTESSPPP
jgi:hypothetical protein